MTDYQSYLVRGCDYEWHLLFSRINDTENSKHHTFECPFFHILFKIITYRIYSNLPAPWYSWCEDPNDLRELEMCSTVWYSYIKAICIWYSEGRHCNNALLHSIEQTHMNLLDHIPKRKPIKFELQFFYLVNSIVLAIVFLFKNLILVFLPLTIGYVN